MSPSGERSQGMSSALTTLGSVSYILRNSCDAAMSSRRRLAVLLPTWAKSRSSRILLILASPLPSHRRGSSPETTSQSKYHRHRETAAHAARAGRSGRASLRERAKAHVSGPHRGRFRSRVDGALDRVEVRRELSLRLTGIAEVDLVQIRQNATDRGLALLKD